MVFVVRYVGWDRKTFAARSSNATLHFVDHFRSSACNDNTGTFGGEKLGNGSTDSSSAAGYDCDLIFKFHCHILIEAYVFGNKSVDELNDLIGSIHGYSVDLKPGNCALNSTSLQTSLNANLHSIDWRVTTSDRSLYSLYSHLSELCLK